VVGKFEESVTSLLSHVTRPILHHCQELSSAQAALTNADYGCVPRPHSKCLPLKPPGARITVADACLRVCCSGLLLLRSIALAFVVAETC
jgi:hypothetical protein